MRNRLTKIIGIFERSDFHPKEELWEAIIIFISWAFPSFIFVVWANAYYPEVEFYQSAINEGIGPNLWNAIGSFGLFSFGVAVAFSSFTTPSKIAKQILSNTYAIGCLTFGLLVGQWYLLPFGELVWWQQGLFGVTSVFLLAVVFAYNSVVWYLGFLIQNTEHKKSEFLIKFEKTHLFCRVGFGLFISSISLLVFLNA